MRFLEERKKNELKKSYFSLWVCNIVSQTLYFDETGLKNV